MFCADEANSVLIFKVFLILHFSNDYVLIEQLSQWLTVWPAL